MLDICVCAIAVETEEREREKLLAAKFRSRVAGAVMDCGYNVLFSCRFSSRRAPLL